MHAESSSFCKVRLIIWSYLRVLIENNNYMYMLNEYITYKYAHVRMFSSLIGRTPSIRTCITLAREALLSEF